MFTIPLSPERPVSPVSIASTAEVTAGYDISTINRTLDISSVHDECTAINLGLKHWIRVTHLDPGTTNKTLKYMFYPYGGDEAFVLWENGVIGYVGFENKYMADLGVGKMDAFIPCGQTQPLSVVHVTTDEVLAAMSTTSFSPQKGLMSLLYSDCPLKLIAEMIEAHMQPCYCAAELVEEIRKASPSMLSRVLDALTELRQSWVSLEEFRESLVRNLLRQILEEEEEQMDLRANCGTLLGKLFTVGFLTGDPFHLASRVLRRGARHAAQINNICAIAHVCASMPFPISKASFWALVGQMSLQAAEPLHSIFRENLRCFHQKEEVLSPVPLALPKNKYSVPRTGVVSLHALADSGSRTVYVSHLPPLLPKQMFMELLMMCGVVNKVRVCRGNGYDTLFAFVEMSTVEEANATLRLSHFELLGCCVRVQIARNSIQDSMPEDVLVYADGTVARKCLFAQSGGTLSDAIVTAEKGAIR